MAKGSNHLGLALFRTGAALGFSAVALGAFGTHALRDRLSEELMRVWQTGTQYQLAHALVVCLCGWISNCTGSKRIEAAGWFFAVGVLLFSGSLYTLSLSGIRALGAITPLGGLALLIGWLILAFSSPNAFAAKSGTK